MRALPDQSGSANPIERELAITQAGNDTKEIMTSTDESVVLRRARKLLNLSRSPNEHEATLAAEMLSELCVRHGIAMTNLSERNAERLNVTQDVVFMAKSKSTWRGYLATGVGKACLIYPIWIRGGNLVFAGNPDNLSIATETFFYLEETIERTCRTWMVSGKGQGRADADSFRMGMASRIARRLIERREEMERTGLRNSGKTDLTGEVTTQDCTAMQVYAAIEKIESANSNFISKQYGQVTKGSSRRVSRGSAYEEGYAAGGNVGLDKQKEVGSGRSALAE